MPVYMVSNVEVHDPDQFRHYQIPGRNAAMQYGESSWPKARRRNPLLGAKADGHRRVRKRRRRADIL